MVAPQLPVGGYSDNFRGQATLNCGHPYPLRTVATDEFDQVLDAPIDFPLDR